MFILDLDDAYGNGIADVVETCSPTPVSRCSGKIAYDPTAASFDAEVGEVVAADPDASSLISFDEGSRDPAHHRRAGHRPDASRTWYGVDGNMGNALGENFDAGT